MDEVRLVGEITRWDRKLYLAIVDDLATWSPDLSHVPIPFAAFCAIDEKVDMKTLEAFGEQLIAAGCRDVHSWGPLDEAIHDAVDTAFIRMTPEEEWDEKFVMTGAGDEDFDAALWEGLFVFGIEWPSVLAISSPAYAEQLERRLGDPDQLARDVVGAEPWDD
jgi:hypothetical protein